MKRRTFLGLPLAAAGLASAGPTPTVSMRARLCWLSLTSTGTESRSNGSTRYSTSSYPARIAADAAKFDTLRPEKSAPRCICIRTATSGSSSGEGNFKFQVGGEIMRLTAGDSLLVPQDMPHAFVTTSEGTARLIVIHQPAATMEEYFRSVITAADQTVEGRRALSQRHGMRILGGGLKAD